MANPAWEVAFHLRAPKGWLNDPNGCCQMGGTYHIFFQYNPRWPATNLKSWGAYRSPDLVTWNFDGEVLSPDTAWDRSGVYTGCARVETAPDGTPLMRVYYTGNVIDLSGGHNPQDVRFTLDGRLEHQLTTTSADGIHFGPKSVIIDASTYPETVTRHVRDPFVWRDQAGHHLMVGARHVAGYGMLLLYRSDDGISWDFERELTTAYPFGYMWECPNLAHVDGRTFLALCPEGLPRTHDRWQSRSQAGYLPLAGDLTDVEALDERTFQEWDVGHDFYAPQCFEDEEGRSLLVGWLGCFDPTQESAPAGLAWTHCLTVVRTLSVDRATGLILQWPHGAYEQLREEGQSLGAHTSVTVCGRHADIVLEQVAGPGALDLDESLEIWWDAGRFGLTYLDERAGAGRTTRSVPLSQLNDLRVLVDGSAVECYANGGALVLSSRWFPATRGDLVVSCTLDARGTVYRMRDELGRLYRIQGVVTR